MAKPVVNEDLCEGCATCEEMCPEVFKIGDDGKAHVVGPDKCNTCNCQEAAEVRTNAIPATARRRPIHALFRQ